MATTASPLRHPRESAGEPASLPGASSRIPWFLWCGALAVTLALIGGAWDVAWHRSIGRDTFWTPAHMAIYSCGLLVGIVSAFLILSTTFFHGPLRSRSVRIFGLRGPLGAFLAAWGGLAMLVSAPFDDWWHNAYGLDVKIVSPPHTLLMLGICIACIGVLLLCAGDERTPSRQRLFLYVGGMITAQQMFFLMEATWDVRLHSLAPYIALAVPIPFFLALLSRASGHRWAATSAAAVYTLFNIAGILLLPLFPAQPKLGPVFFPVTHFVPAKFPILILAPAVCLDLLFTRFKPRNSWKLAIVAGVLFTVVLLVVEWPFASFLMTRFAANRFFGTGYFDFSTRPMSPDRLRHFVNPTHGPALLLGIARAMLYAILTTWLGLQAGEWMRRLRR